MNPRHWGVLIAAGLAFALLAIAALALTSKWDVASTLRANAADQGFAVAFKRAHLSASHGLVVSFDIHGDSELRTAHWYLWPLRKVVVSK